MNKKNFKNKKTNDLLDVTKTVRSSIDNSPTLKLDKVVDFDVMELVNESHLNMEYVGETIESKARDILGKYGFKIQIKKFYAYLMREIMRNVVEHSEATNFRVGLYSNNLNEFSFKVIDNGIGIKKSLTYNPMYDFTNDLTALAFCVRPGITRSYKRDPFRDDVWQNSGFGLYMVSSIVNDIGYFQIASGNSSLIIKNRFKEFRNSKINGTEVTVTINANIKINIAETITKVSKEGNRIVNTSDRFAEFAQVKTASKASTLLK